MWKSSSTHDREEAQLPSGSLHQPDFDFRNFVLKQIIFYMEEAEELRLWDVLPLLSLSNIALSSEVIFFFITLIHSKKYIVHCVSLPGIYVECVCLCVCVFREYLPYCG